MVFNGISPTRRDCHVASSPQAHFRARVLSMFAFPVVQGNDINDDFNYPLAK